MYRPEKFETIIPHLNETCEYCWLQKFAVGDRQAFEWIYKNYCQKIYSYAFIITNDQHMSEDLVHDVFIKLWVNKERLKSVQNFNGYLYRLYKNLLFDKLKNQQLESKVRKIYFYDSLKPIRNSNEILLVKELEQKMEKAIRQLPKQQQVVYRLIREQNWKRDQIAKHLEISPFTVKSHMQKAIGKLRAKCTEVH